MSHLRCFCWLQRKERAVVGIFTHYQSRGGDAALASILESAMAQDERAENHLITSEGPDEMIDEVTLARLKFEMSGGRSSGDEVPAGETEAASVPAQIMRKLGKLSRQKFLKAYLTEEEKIFGQLRWIFKAIMFLAVAASVISGLFFLYVASAVGFYGLEILLPILAQIVQYIVVFWLFSLAGQYIDLRRAKIANELYSADRDLREVQKVTRKAMEKVREAAKSITAGDNAIIIVDSTTGPVEMRIEGGKEVTDAVALLLAYARNSGDAEAVAAADEIAKEAGKAKPDGPKVFSLWNGLIQLLPDVVKIAEIAQGMAKLFV